MRLTKTPTLSDLILINGQSPNQFAFSSKLTLGVFGEPIIINKAMIKLLTRLVPLAIILGLSFFAIKSLLYPGYFSMHDDQQIARLFELDKSLRAGQFPVRWVDGLGFGYGYPLFNFYPPLVYYLGEAIHLVLQLGFIDSIKIVWFLALFGSAISMYFLSKEFFGRIGGIVSAAFYLYAPYHAVDAYVRGALAELSSFVWLPLVLLLSYKTVKTQSVRYALTTGFTLALLILTHNLIFLPFVAIFAFWHIVITMIYLRRNFLSSIFCLLSSLVIALGLSAFFWLPAILEKGFTLVDSLLIKNLASYQIHFVCLEQLWNSPWGFGGSNPGCLDGISLKIGKLHTIAALLSVTLIVIFWKNKDKALLKLTLLILGLFLLSALMTTELSRPIWDALSPLWYLQFPWRFLEFVVLFSSLLVGAITFIFKSRTIKLGIAAILVFLIIFQNAKLFSPQQYLVSANDSQLTSDYEIKWRVSSTSFEFMSKDVATKINEKGVVWVDIDESQIQYTKYKILNGDWRTGYENFLPDKFLLTGETQNGTILQFQISYFPGWKIWLDGQPANFNVQNKLRLLDVSIPPGSHTITGQFTNTSVRTTANIISVLSVMIAVGVTGFLWKRKS